MVTTDFSLEGRHFRRGWHPPAAVGHRTLARGLSDLAAMGARPVAAFLSLALPRNLAADPAWLDGFLDGLFALADRVGVPLAGGDTAEAPDGNVIADIVLLGAVPRGRALRRDGARPGDRLFCTGELGGSAAELESLSGQRRSGQQPASCPPANLHGRQASLHPHLFPDPQLAVGQALLQRGLATAAIDLSDGLSTDLRHLCSASGVAAEVDAAQVPIHALAAALGPTAALSAALHGGEDYQLLFAAPPRAKVPAAIAGLRLTEIGRCLARGSGQPTVAIRAIDGRRTALKAGGWEHLR